MDSLSYKDVKATAPSFTQSSPYNLSWIRGNKSYELSNHLGNVLATISDIKFGADTNNDGVIDYYTADIVGASDYYPFGATMPNRITGTSYRYGFNGKEKDKEGSVQYDYGFRIYDPRLGRFKSVDPLTKSYPWISTYAFAENDVIRCIDLDGLEKYLVTNYWKNGVKERTEIEAFRDIDSKHIINMQFKLSGAPLTDKNVAIYDIHDEGTKKEIIYQTDAANLTTEQNEIFTHAFTVKKLLGGKAVTSNNLDADVTNGEVTSTKGILHQQASKNYNTDGGNATGKSLNKKIDLTPGVGTDVFIMAHDTYKDGKIHAGIVVDNGTIAMEQGLSTGLKSLVSQIKSNGGVANINITGQYNFVPNTSNEDAKTIQTGVNNFSQNLTNILKAAGAKNVNVNINIGASSTNRGFRNVQASY